MDQNNDVTLRELTSDDVIAYLVDHNVNSDCPSCGHSVSSILMADDPAHVRISGLQAMTINYESNLLSVNQRKVLSTVAAECENCGSVRFFNYRSILLWLKDKASKEAP